VAVWKTQNPTKTESYNIKKFLALTSDKHFEQDTETACSVICTLLEQLIHLTLAVLHGVPEHAVQTKIVFAVLTVGILWRFPGHWRQHTAGLSRPEVRHLVT
jgi:hypothetical protein